MSDKSQEGYAKAQEQKKFMAEFIRISSVSILNEYEKKNREKILNAPFVVKEAFDELWTKVTGNSYFQPITTIQAPVATLGRNNTERSDPRSRKYMANVVFNRVMWTKIRRKMSKKMRDFYILRGEVAETGLERPIFQNLDKNRLRHVLGDKAADKILSVKGETEGEIKGKFDLMVEGFWMVQFSPKKDQNDPEDVRLLWEGQCLIAQRMQEVFVPGFYLEVADNATRDNYIQTPESGRKLVGVIQEYPYTVIREASMGEYLEQKDAGDTIMNETRARMEG